MIVRQVETSLSESAQVFIMLASLSGGSERMITNLHVVCNFPKVFPYDISDFPLECLVDFAIDLVSGISLVSMYAYKIYSSELSELKKQLEDLL